MPEIERLEEKLKKEKNSQDSNSPMYKLNDAKTKMRTIMRKLRAARGASNTAAIEQKKMEYYDAVHTKHKWKRAVGKLLRQRKAIKHLLKKYDVFLCAKSAEQDQALKEVELALRNPKIAQLVLEIEGRMLCVKERWNTVRLIRKEQQNLIKRKANPELNEGFCEGSQKEILKLQADFDKPLSTVMVSMMILPLLLIFCVIWRLMKAMDEVPKPKNLLPMYDIQDDGPRDTDTLDDFSD